MFKKCVRPLIFGLLASLLMAGNISCGDNKAVKNEQRKSEKSNISVDDESISDNYDNQIIGLMVSPENPAPGEGFRIMATGGRNIFRAKIVIYGPTENSESVSSTSGGESPCWRIDKFAGNTEGNYIAALIVNNSETANVEFKIAPFNTKQKAGMVWKTTRSWDITMENFYSAWINALFMGCDEQSSWPALHEVTRNPDRNFLYNYLCLGEDDPTSKINVIMEPDCADNPFFLRAYFSWKLGLPFGFHICDRGYIGRNPQTGQWITNESSSSKENPVLAFNSFVRRIMDGVHSGTARTSLDNETSDYYPVTLERKALRPGTVYADPYGHTLVIVGWINQTDKKPGQLLAMDAQPDNSIAIKRFWKGNFLFNTTEVVGEPGFKAFRPILQENGKLRLLKNEALNDTSGFTSYSLQQRKMESSKFYLAMERIINPDPLDPESALLDLVQALHEQLQVRVKSVANGEAYLKSHPGTVIPMPSNARGIFQTGGLWEDFSTPNRDLRLLIAIDAVIGFPDRVADFPEDFKISGLKSPEEIRKKLHILLDKKVSKLKISYTRTDGSMQELTLAEILKRKDAFEMAYNPNDGIEIRWGAPENSEERATCKRHAPANQQKTMQSERKWFIQRLHPPT